MQPLRVVNAVADLSRLYALAFLVPIPFAFAYEPYDLDLGFMALPSNAIVFAACFLIVMLYWFPLHALTRRVRDDELQDKEAYLTVGIGWIVLTLFSMLPFLMSGVLTSPVDAFFETMAGLTTTGATTIEGSLEDVARSIMLWRALLQFIGGMGIIVLGVAILARLTQGGMQLLQAEAPGPSVTRLRPKLTQTAKVLWTVYGIFSVILWSVLFVLFLAHDVALSDAVYDAFVHTFTALSTGGFSNHSASIAHYGSAAIEAVLVVAMLVAGSSFALHWHVIHGDWRRLFKDPEWRWFMGGFFFVTLAVSGLLWAAGQAFFEALRGAAFTVASIGTSTGYGTVDFDQWPDAARLILLVLMFTGGTAGSTAGGMKVVRILILMKLVRRALRKLLHPRAVIPIRLGSKPLKDETIWAVIAFFFTYITLWMFATILIVATDPVLELIDGASAAASSLGNTGPGLGVVGPTSGYWDLLPSTKLVLAFLMWAGRLEIFAALIVFSPRSWRN